MGNLQYKPKAIKVSDFLEREDSDAIQGIAVLLMVFHHLFGFPERIHVPYQQLIASFESVLSYFGRICIPMLAFLSGYGFTRKTDLLSSEGKKTTILENYKGIGKSLLSFFVRYWLVFFVFVIYGLIVKIYPFEIKVFVKALFGLNDFYNHEWWYVADYLILLIAFPLLYAFLNQLRKKTHIIISISFWSIVIVGGTVLLRLAPENAFLQILLSFVLGMVLEIYAVPDRVYAHLINKDLTKTLLGILLFAAVLIAKSKIITHGGYNHLWGALMVISSALVVKTNWMKRSINYGLRFLGKYGIYIWLTHTFFAYYYFQKLTYLPYYSWLIYLWCLVLSTGTGVILEYIIKTLTDLIKKLRERCK